MNMRNKVIAGAAVGLSAAAIWAGVAVSSSALAAEAPDATADITLVVPAPDGNGAISCEFQSVPIESAIATGEAALTGEVEAADSGTIVVTAGPLPADPAGGSLSGTGTISGDLIVSSSATAIPVDPNAAPVTVSGSGELSFSSSALLISDNIRPGTPEECSAVLPGGVLAP